MLRIVPKIDLTGFEHQIVESKIRLRNGIVEEDGTPSGAGGRCLDSIRAPAAAVIQDATRTDGQQLQGAWRLLSGALNGRPGSADAKIRWTVAGDKIVMELGNRWEGKYTLDPSKSPKRINLVARSDDGARAEEIRGVYEVHGDKLCVCLSFGDEPRPEILRSSPGAGQVSLALTRQPTQPDSKPPRRNSVKN